MASKVRHQLAGNINSATEIHDNFLKELLSGRTGDVTSSPNLSSNEYNEALNYMAQQIQYAREVVLSTSQSKHAPSWELLSKDYRPEEGKSAQTCWQKIMNDAGCLAIRIADAFESEPTPHSATQQNTLSGAPNAPELISRRLELARPAVRALRLYLLAQLYLLRVDVNDAALSTSEVVFDAKTVGARIRRPTQRRFRRISREERDERTISSTRLNWKSPLGVINRIEVHIRQYNAKVSTWRIKAWLPPGELHRSDAYTFNNWRSDFGAINATEPGWGTTTRYVRVLLRFLRYKADFLGWLDSLWRLAPQTERAGGFLVIAIVAILRFIRAILLIPLCLVQLFVVVAFQIMTFIALRPAIFAYMTVFTIPFFAALHFADDYLFSQNIDGCTSATAAPNVFIALQNNFVPDAFSSMVTLTSLGGGIIHCGRFANLLIAAESLTGYFLLSILAGLIFTWLTNP